jgi:hypothetical protein
VGSVLELIVIREPDIGGSTFVVFDCNDEVEGDYSAQEPELTGGSICSGADEDTQLVATIPLTVPFIAMAVEVELDHGFEDRERVNVMDSSGSSNVDPVLLVMSATTDVGPVP